MRTNLQEKIAVVTGASSGLGAQFARVLAANGALVVLTARRLDLLKELRAQIESKGGAADVVPLDVADPLAIEVAVDKIEAENGPIDILVNNAGIATPARLTETTPVDFDDMFATNVRGAFFMAQAVARRMIARARTQQNFCGRIVNIASTAALRTVPQLGAYGMTKAALVQMTRSQAQEWGRYGINVNAICPGYMQTPMNAGQRDPEQEERLLQTLPRKRAGLPADLDALLLTLVAEESRLINGAVIAADDGLSVS